MSELTTFNGQVYFYDLIFIGQNNQFCIDNEYIETNNSSTTVIYQSILTENMASLVQYDVCAFNTTDGSSATYSQYCKLNYGSLGTIPNLQVKPNVSLIDLGMLLCSASIVAITNGYEIRVNGLIGKNIKWSVVIKSNSCI